MFPDEDLTAPDAGAYADGAEAPRPTPHHRCH
jgi:hypothetical protein